MPTALSSSAVDLLMEGRQPPPQAPADEECGDWGPPPEIPSADKDDKELQPMSCLQFVGAIGVMCLSLPAIIGAWCWPMVVAALISIGTSTVKTPGNGVVDFFHGFQVALMMTVMFNLVQFVYWRCNQSRRGSCWQKHSPTFWTLISAILTNVQPMWILIIGSWKLCCAPCSTFGLDPSSCNGGKTYPVNPGEPIRPCDIDGNVFWDSSFCDGSKLSTFPSKASGWAVQILCTWGGFAFMFVGILQATQLHKKMGKQWRAIRAGRR